MKHKPKTCFLTIKNGKSAVIVIKKDEVLSLILQICDDNDGYLIEIVTKSCGVRYLHFADKYDAVKQWFRIMHDWQDMYEKSTIYVDPPFFEIRNFLAACFPS